MSTLKRKLQLATAAADRIEQQRINADIARVRVLNPDAINVICHRYHTAADYQTFIKAAQHWELLAIQWHYADYLTRCKTEVPAERIRQLIAGKSPYEQWTDAELQAAVGNDSDLETYDWEAISDEDLDRIEQAETSEEQNKILDKYRKEGTPHGKKND